MLAYGRRVSLQDFPFIEMQVSLLSYEVTAEKIDARWFITGASTPTDIIDAQMDIDEHYMQHEFSSRLRRHRSFITPRVIECTTISRHQQLT